MAVVDFLFGEYYEWELCLLQNLYCSFNRGNISAFSIDRKASQRYNAKLCTGLFSKDSRTP